MAGRETFVVRTRAGAWVADCCADGCLQLGVIALGEYSTKAEADRAASRHRAWHRRLDEEHRIDSLDVADMTPEQLRLAVAGLRQRVHTALAVLSHRGHSRQSAQLAEKALRGAALTELTKIEPEGVA